MKKLMSVLFFSLALVAIVFGNGIDVPVKVNNAFKTKFPDATEVTWMMENGIYTANFMDKDYAISCSFDKSGNWEKTVTELYEEDLSEEIISYLNEEYEFPPLLSAEKITTSLGTQFSVLIEVEKVSEDEDEETEITNYLITFDETGNFLKSQILK